MQPCSSGISGTNTHQAAKVMCLWWGKYFSLPVSTIFLSQSLCLDKVYTLSCNAHAHDSNLHYYNTIALSEL